jgi:cytochrome c oxidase subunit 2
MSIRLLSVALVVVATAATPTVPAVRAAAPVHEIQVVAKKYAFEPSTIDVVAGEQVRLTIRSTDTDHGFAIKALKIDVDIPKDGRPVTVDFVAPAPGQYPISCSNFCGFGHSKMKAMLESHAPQVLVNRKDRR